MAPQKSKMTKVAVTRRTNSAIPPPSKQNYPARTSPNPLPEEGRAEEDLNDTAGGTGATQMPAKSAPPTAAPVTQNTILSPEMLASLAAFWNQTRAGMTSPLNPPIPNEATSSRRSEEPRPTPEEVVKKTGHEKGGEVQERPPLFTIGQLEEILERRRRSEQGGLLPEVREDATHPFSKRLVSLRVPPEIVARKIADYTGEGDPVKHINNHNSSLLGRGATSDHYAVLFPTTLSGDAATWFYGLPPHSIDSWEELKERFTDGHIGQRHVLKSADTLYHTTQMPDESLADYYNRYHRALQQIDEAVTDGEVIRCFYRGLSTRGQALKDSMVKKPVRKMEILAIRVKRYIDLERSWQSQEMYKRPADSEVKEPRREAKKESRPVQPDRSKPRNDRPERRYQDGYTPLTRNISVVLQEMERLSISDPPLPRKNPMGRQMDAYCRYHRAKGHDTDDCYSLKRDIEALIQRGKLKNFIARKEGDRERSRSPRPRLPAPPPLENTPKKGIINTLSGGYAAGGETSAAREIYATQISTAALLGKQPTGKGNVITFSDEDMVNVTHPHQDALVVTALVAGYEVKRILIDGGSSSDILFYEAFLTLGYTKKDLKKVDFPLVGFAGRTTYPLGVIVLPMILGKGDKILRLDTLFVVVDAASAYNIILGRTTLNCNRIVPSTAHQVIKFVTPNGQGEVRGDQPASRNCYVNSLRHQYRE